MHLHWIDNEVQYICDGHFGILSWFSFMFTVESLEIKSTFIEEKCIETRHWAAHDFYNKISTFSKESSHFWCIVQTPTKTNEQTNMWVKVWMWNKEKTAKSEGEWTILLGFFPFCAKLLRIIYETNQTRLLRSFNWCKSKLNKSRTRWTLFSSPPSPLSRLFAPLLGIFPCGFRKCKY